MPEMMSDLESAVVQYAHAASWVDAFALLRSNRSLLLTPQAESLLQRKWMEYEAMDTSSGFGLWYAGQLEARLTILHVARAQGIDAAWQRVQPFIRPRDALDDEVDRVWDQWKKDHPD